MKNLPKYNDFLNEARLKDTSLKQISKKEFRDLKIKIWNAYTSVGIFTKDEAEFLKSLLANSTNESELNEKKVMDLDVLLNRFQDSDYDMDNSSLKDLENFVDFIRDYLDEAPRGTIIEADSLGHPSHIRIRNTKAQRINRINALYDAYHNLAKHMQEAGEDPEKVAKIQQKADELFKHIKID